MPPNATATVYMPARSPDQVREGNPLLTAAKGVQTDTPQAGYVPVRVGSGHYHFTAPAPVTVRSSVGRRINRFM
ncbi:hypothetical protein [Hymenobacter crusticola]|uniref:Uncharacterized protein n=1 Tax=Hymenobacter crusticola TaxID=1770526 RepID=A0A243W854_9BACT|nr:hypothetical protein [Hymenobacter crusticola]OUJ71248.1 hypothetical protein BXP70_22490 [Hymenobacter crusticola]